MTDEATSSPDSAKKPEDGKPFIPGMTGNRGGESLPESQKPSNGAGVRPTQSGLSNGKPLLPTERLDPAFERIPEQSGLSNGKPFTEGKPPEPYQNQRAISDTLSGKPKVNMTHPGNQAPMFGAVFNRENKEWEPQKPASFMRLPQRPVPGMSRDARTGPVKAGFFLGAVGTLLGAAGYVGTKLYSDNKKELIAAAANESKKEMRRHLEPKIFDVFALREANGGRILTEAEQKSYDEILDKYELSGKTTDPDFIKLLLAHRPDSVDFKETARNGALFLYAASLEKDDPKAAEELMKCLFENIDDLHRLRIKDKQGKELPISSVLYFGMDGIVQQWSNEAAAERIEALVKKMQEVDGAKLAWVSGFRFPKYAHHAHAQAIPTHQQGTYTIYSPYNLYKHAQAVLHHKAGYEGSESEECEKLDKAYRESPLEFIHALRRLDGNGAIALEEKRKILIPMAYAAMLDETPENAGKIAAIIANTPNSTGTLSLICSKSGAPMRSIGEVLKSGMEVDKKDPSANIRPWNADTLRDAIAAAQKEALNANKHPRGEPPTPGRGR